MRSFLKRPGTALLAAAALFAVITTSSTANAFTLRAHDLVATSQSGPESVQNVAVSWWDARQARRDVAQTLRQDCRNGDTRRNRRVCYRDARSEMRDLRNGARQTFRDCRTDGGNRPECRQAVWQYWINQANGGGADTGGEVTDIPPDDVPR